MRLNATSSVPSFIICVTSTVLVILISVNQKAYAKRGCSSFGHSCYGGHGKRFDSTMQRNTLQDRASQNVQEAPLPNDKLFYVLSNNDKLRKRPEAFIETDEDDMEDNQQDDVLPLSAILNQWMALHPRSNRRKKMTL
ncbi:uncharacterized protein [Temnothorax longispinosus]|uniref:uncharacterized protein n=1 Tax=Temnothorax longispinosus TaxID=300112 RepID=UPI003A9A4EB8